MRTGIPATFEANRTSTTVLAMLKMPARDPIVHILTRLSIGPYDYRRVLEEQRQVVSWEMSVEVKDVTAKSWTFVRELDTQAT